MTHAHKQKKSIRNTSQITNFPRKYTLTKTNWLTLPLGLLAITCWYFFSTTIPSTHSLSSLLILPTYAAFFVGLFSTLYIYCVLARRYINLFVQVLGWVFSIIFIASAAYIILGSGSICTGLFGVLDNCSNVHYFRIYTLLLNPYTLPVFNFFAIAGAIGLLINIRMRHQ